MKPWTDKEQKIHLLLNSIVANCGDSVSHNAISEMKAKSERMAFERTDFWALAEHVRDTAIADRLLRRGDILARITEKETLRAIKDDLNTLQNLDQARKSQLYINDISFKEMCSRMAHLDTLNQQLQAPNRSFLQINAFEPF